MYRSLSLQYVHCSAQSRRGERLGPTITGPFMAETCPIPKINPRNVSSLVPAWTFPTGDAVTASPAVVDGVVYGGSWDGYLYAIDATTGNQKWKVQPDCQASVVPLPQVCSGPGPGTADPGRFRTPRGIATSSAAVVGDRILFGGGRTLYRVAADDGRIV
jgi:outer membrane protein assembly factor BamB